MDSSNKNHSGLSRRRFLEQSLMSATTVMAGLTAGPSHARAAACTAGAKRQHLINISAQGGWDSLWFHNGVDQSDYPATVVSRRPGTPSGFHGSVFGPGMSVFNSTARDNLLVWRGLTVVNSEGGHSVSNRVLNLGADSPYRPSYSALLAKKLANDYQCSLPLHYVQISPNSASVFSTPGQETGAAIPTLIPDLKTWTSLTAPQAGDVSKGRRDYMDKMVKQLILEFQRAAVRKSSALMSNGFYNAFDQGLLLRGQNLAESPDFKRRVSAYHTQLTQTLTDHLLKPVNPKPILQLADIELPSPSWADWTQELAFRFGLAEYLVANNLSAVVELRAPVGDYHDCNFEQKTMELMTFKCYSLLVQRLVAADLLKYTTVVMHSEFERSPLFSVNAPSYSDTPGTNHWTSSSVLMSGRGIRTGRVIGDFMQKKYEPTFNPTMYGFFKALPINPTLGTVTPTGELVTQKSFYPSILDALDVPLPPNLNTGSTKVIL